jgi:hypothetical protein
VIEANDTRGKKDVVVIVSVPENCCNTKINLTQENIRVLYCYYQCPSGGKLFMRYRG